MPRSYTRIIMIVGAVLIVLFGGLAFYFYKQFSDLRAHPETAVQADSQHVISEVEKLYGSLPNETPTLAAIKDKTKLQDQAFFKNAENGDYLLVYPNAKIAIIYREQDNKIINVGPISVGTQTQASAQK